MQAPRLVEVNAQRPRLKKDQLCERPKYLIRDQVKCFRLRRRSARLHLRLANGNLRQPKHVVRDLPKALLPRHHVAIALHLHPQDDQPQTVARRKVPKHHWPLPQVIAVDSLLLPNNLPINMIIVVHLLAPALVLHQHQHSMCHHHRPKSTYRIQTRAFRLDYPLRNNTLVSSLLICNAVPRLPV